MPRLSPVPCPPSISASVQSGSADSLSINLVPPRCQIIASRTGKSDCLVGEERPEYRALALSMLPTWWTSTETRLDQGACTTGLRALNDAGNDGLSTFFTAGGVRRKGSPSPQKLPVDCSTRPFGVELRTELFPHPRDPSYRPCDSITMDSGPSIMARWLQKGYQPHIRL